MSGGVGRELLIEMYGKMLLIRHFEQKVTQLFLKGLVPGTIHLSTGQEAVAVGATSCLGPADAVMLTHRPHGQALAKGLDPGRLLAEILGRRDGCCGGRGGSMHLADPARGVMPTLPIVGAGLPIAAGIAFACQRSGSDAVAMAFLGDGATNIGAFHEAMNLAAVWKLPVVYVCENNLYAVSTRIQSSTLVTDLARRAAAYGMPAASVDGNDVEGVYAGVLEAVRRARAGQGPGFVECKTYRHSGHSRTDPATYRDPAEVEAWKARDPLPRCRRALVERGWLLQEQCDRLEEEKVAAVEEAARFAAASPEPEGGEALGAVYCGEGGG